MTAGVKTTVAARLRAGMERVGEYRFQPGDEGAARQAKSKMQREGWRFKQIREDHYVVGWRAVARPGDTPEPAPKPRRRPSPKARAADPADLPQIGTELTVTMLIWNGGEPVAEVRSGGSHWIVRFGA